MPSKNKSFQWDALVVGAGPTGLVMANELLRHGVRTRIIDKSAHPSDKSKALVVQVRSQEMLENMGLIEEALKSGKKVRHFNAYMDGHQIARVEFAKLDSPYPYPLMLEQSCTEQILLNSLKEKGLEVEREKELVFFSQDEDKVIARLRNAQGSDEEIQVPWILGCDGSHSLVRHTLDLPFHGAEYPETFILADVQLDWELAQNELFIFFKHDGVMGVLPMHEDNRFRLMGIRPPSEGDLRGDPDLEEIQALVDEYAPTSAKVHDPRWLAKFRLHRRGVPRYRVGRAFVAGDAAHIHSPVGGQGMNTGMQDSYNLAWKLGLVAKGKAHPDILESYNSERQPVGHFVLKSTDRIFDLAVSQNPVLRFFRNHIFPHFMPALSKAAGKKVATFVSELQVQYRKSPIVAEQPGSTEMHLKDGPKAGERAPDGQIQTLDSKNKSRIFEIFQDPRHILLVFKGTEDLENSGPDWEKFISLIDGNYKDLISLFAIFPQGSRALKILKADRCFTDPSLACHQKYGVESGGLYLIRPDGYVAYRSRKWEAGNLEEYLKRIFIV